MANFTTNYDKITVDARNNHLSGNGGGDAFDGQANYNTLTGGTGQKKFAAPGASNADTDFATGADATVFAHTVFKGPGELGILAPDKVCLGAAADSDDNVIADMAGGYFLAILEEVLRSAGLGSVRRAAQTPFNLILEARH